MYWKIESGRRKKRLVNVELLRNVIWLDRLLRLFIFTSMPIEECLKVNFICVYKELTNKEI